MTDSQTARNMLEVLDREAIPMAIATLRRHMKGKIAADQSLNAARQQLINDGRILEHSGDGWFDDPLTQKLRTYYSGTPYFMSAAAYEKLKNSGN